jgi:hypothetical protein
VTNPSSLRKLVFADHDSYAGFDASRYDTDPYGWYYDHPIFEEAIKRFVPPKGTIIEVGTLYGASAIHMATVCKRLGKLPEILCVDTFIGALEAWSNPSALKLRFGFPRFYEQFLANVVKAQHTDIITPCPMTSADAARFLAKHSRQADLIYLDASHEYEDVARDIRAFWPLVRPGGLLLGDDFDFYYLGVIEAVLCWARNEGGPSAPNGCRLLHP